MYYIFKHTFYAINFKTIFFTYEFVLEVFVMHLLYDTSLRMVAGVAEKCM
jgi:hypothetical protein